MTYVGIYVVYVYTLSEARSGVDWVNLMAAQGAFGTDFYDRSILRLKHRAYYRSGRQGIGMRMMNTLPSQAIDLRALVLQSGLKAPKPWNMLLLYK